MYSRNVSIMQDLKTTAGTRPRLEHRPSCTAAQPQLDQAAPLPGVGAASRLEDPQGLAEVRVLPVLLFVASTIPNLYALDSNLQNTIHRHSGRTAVQVQHVSKQLLQLHRALGSREDIDVVSMVMREPRCGK